jgi:hypothetical protein
MRALLVAVASSVLWGCGGVASEFPASDETTTQLDARLVGFWRIDWEASTPKGEGPKTDRGESVLAIGRKEGADQALEMVSLELDAESKLALDRNDLRATTIGGRSYASVTGGKIEKWVVVRYDVADEETLRVSVMDEKVVAADVRSKAAAGTVEESKATGSDEPTTHVLLTMPTAVLRSYLERRGDDVYRRDGVLVLRRVRLK